MKLPITDKFLWSVYKFFEKAEDALEAPEIFQLRSWSNIGPSLDKEYWKNLKRKKERKQFSQFIYHLKKKGYIKIANLEGKSGILLTEKGKRKALQADAQIGEKAKRKDGKWIMIMYDIPEKKYLHRKKLRQILKGLGYEKFQKSVWVTPYNVFEKTRNLLGEYGLDDYVRLFIIEEIEI